MQPEIVRQEAFVFLVHFIFNPLELQKCQSRDCNYQRKTVTNWEILFYYRIVNFSDKILAFKRHRPSSPFSIYLTVLEEESYVQF